MHRYKKLFTVLFFLAVLLALFELSGLGGQFSPGFLQQRILENKTSGLLIFVLLFVLGNLIQVPGWVFLAAAVLTLGPALGGFVTYIAASISCIVTFLTIRLLGDDALRQLNSRLADQLLDRLDAHPVASILLLRVLFQTVPALNYALALSGVRFRSYLLGTLLGLPLPVALYCLFFDYLANMLEPVS